MINKDFRDHIKAKVVIGFILSIAAVVVAAVLAFNATENLRESVQRLSQPNRKLEKFHEILYDLNQAEGSVRAYTLSRDPEDLSQYFQRLYSVEKHLDSLQLLSLNDDQMLTALDTLSLLLDKKINIYSQLIELRKSSPSGGISPELLTRIESDLQNRVVYRKQLVTREGEGEEKKSVFGKLKKFFTGEEEAPEEVQDTVTVRVVEPATGVTTQKVKELIRENEQRRKAEIEERQKTELALMQADMELMDQIRNLLYSLQTREAEENALVAEEARIKGRDTIKVIIGILAIMLACMIVFLSLIFRDITMSKKYRAELIEARGQAEKLARVKEQLLANMSHEIRTPLNAILGFSEQLKGTQLDAQQKEYLEALYRSSDLLLHTVNDILHFSKLEAGKMKIEEIPFKIEEVLTDTISTVKDQARKKGLEVFYKMDPKLRQIFIGDPYRMKQILINLTSNGIKFTDRGSVSINATIEEESPDNLQARFHVTDTGIGIPKEKLNSIFEEFNQADTSITRKFGGTGLGLTIVKKLVELQNGSIEVNSETDKGTEFIVILPFKKARKGARESIGEEITVQPEMLEGKKILLVDDDEMNQLLGKTILKKWKVDLDQAYTGKEALDMIRDNPYDVVLMDIQMPEMSGMDVTREVRSHLPKPASETPILAVTANVIKSDIETYMEAGMNDYLLKPYNEKDLFRKIASALHLDNGGDGAHRPLKVSYNLKDLNTLANNDKEFMLKFLETFIKEAEKGTNNMMAMVQEKRYEDLPPLAHRLIPSMVHVGADEVVPVLRSIEKIRHGETRPEQAPELVMKAVGMINHVLQLIYSEVEKLKEDKDGGEK